MNNGIPKAIFTLTDALSTTWRLQNWKDDWSRSIFQSESGYTYTLKTKSTRCITKVAIKILDKELMKQVSEKAQMLKEEREKRQIIANQKKAYYESLRQKRIEQENDDSEDSDEDEKPVRFDDLIQEMMKRKEEFEKVTLPNKPSPAEATMKFLSTFQVIIPDCRKKLFY
jgi:hypothetical protein